MKKTIATILLLALLIGVMAPYTVALAGSYKGDTKYAGWYTVYRTSNYLSINNKPENSSHDGVKRNGKAKNGDQVYITDAQAGAGTAKKWGKVTKVKDQKTGKEKSVNGYACMYFLKKNTPNPTSSPDSKAVKSYKIYCTNGDTISTRRFQTKKLDIVVETIYNDGSSSISRNNSKNGITFRSTNSAIVTVDDEGTLRPYKVGEAKIIVECEKANKCISIDVLVLPVL